jgi:hypothetical protein
MVEAPLKILCVSVHPVLEYDEIELFEELGHEVFTLGFFFHRTTAGNLRPPLEESEWHRQCKREFTATGCERLTNNVQWSVTTEFCSLFDVIIVHHNYHFIVANWDRIRSKPVVWRTIGQELHWAEDAMRPYRERGVKIVRWSPEEKFIERYIGEDAVIRAAKNPADWGEWTGERDRILTFNNNFRARGSGMSFDFYHECMQGLPCDLYGLNNDDVPGWRGTADPNQQRALLCSHRLAFVTGTYPAPYTLGFIEAWMTGIPVVHVGRKRFTRGTRGAYEIDQLITNGESGFLVEEAEEARAIFNILLSDIDLCRHVSIKGRAAAIKNFGRQVAQVNWNEFFRNHIVR